MNALRLCKLTFTVNASDTDGSVVKVEYYATLDSSQNYSLIGSSTQAPYTFQWTGVPPRYVAIGETVSVLAYFVYAKAYDNQGATGDSPAQQVYVDAPPSVSLTNPAPNATFIAPANIALQAQATDDNIVSSVAFYNGNTLITTLTSPPYNFTWTGVPQGTYSLTARATDDFGATTTSSPVTVTVNSAAAQLYFIEVDYLNTPRMIANQAGATVWRWDNTEPFGDSIPNGDPNNTGSNFDFLLRFPGQYSDKETNLSYNWMRDYDASIGRYVQSDPLGLRGGIDLYLYVGGKPGRFVDPAGLEAWNGNILPGHEPQKPGCDIVGGPPLNFDRNECARKCCAEHDECFDEFKCNASSWGCNLLGLYFGLARVACSDRACPTCNARAVICIYSGFAFGCDTPSCGK